VDEVRSAEGEGTEEIIGGKFGSTEVSADEAGSESKSCGLGELGADDGDRLDWENWF
jgi:hypothetical protein